VSDKAELTHATDELFVALSTWIAAVGGAASGQAAGVLVSFHERVEQLEKRVTALEEQSHLKERERNGNRT
jgi:hypothetical protein